MRLPKPTYANVMSTVAVFIALGGTSYAVASLPKNSVGDRQLKNNAVTSEKIKDGAVTAADLAPGAVQSGPRGPRGADGAPGPAGAGAGPAEPWRALDLVGPWTNFAGPDHAWHYASFRKDQLGIVHLRGLITFGGGPPPEQQIIATLPPDYRPAHAELFSVDSASTHQAARIDIYSDGRVVRYIGATGSPNYTSLSGISFSTD